MATIISTKTSGVGGLEVTGDATGILQLASNNGTTAITVDASQNVGIGTTSPSVKVDVQTSADAILNMQSTGTIQSAVLNLTGRQASVDNLWSLVATGSALAGSQLRFTKGGWTGTPSMLIDSSNNLQFNSGYGSVATAYGCRAWVNFNGTGTVAIRASGNVTSITDNGTGNYTVNFTTAMPDANYGFSATSSRSVIAAGNAGNAGPITSDPTASAIRIGTANGASGVEDALYVAVVIFR